MGNPMDGESSQEPLIPLKAGDTTSDRRLDRVDDKDPRSREFPVAAIIPQEKKQKPRSFRWSPGKTLDQGRNGACVGFAWAHELSAEPAPVKNVTEQFARERIYFEAQRIDRYPGGTYPGAFPFLEGTSVLGGAKTVQSMGYIQEYRWAFDIEDVMLAVGYMGPVVFGCTWPSAMNDPDEMGFVSPRGIVMGKHCILLYGVEIVLDSNNEVSLQESYFTFQNSWGPEWGIQGSGKLRFIDVQELWNGAESCISIGRSVRPMLVPDGNR